MSSRAARNTRVQRWLAGGLRTVLLSSGTIFAVKMPDVEELLTKGLIPPALRAIALKFGAASIQPETMEQEELADLLRLMRTMVANELRYVWNGDIEPIETWARFDPKLVLDADAEDGTPGWIPVTVTLGDLEEGSIDGDDYAALQGIATRQFSPIELTAMHLKDRQLLSDSEADRQIEDARKDTVSAWGSFRGGRRSGESGASGGSVEDRSGKPDRRTKRSAARSADRVPSE